MGTSGSEGGQQKPTRRKPGRALLADPTPGRLNDTVLVDNVGGTKQAAEYLLSLGHTRIGQIHGNPASTPGRERWAALHSVLLEHELETPGDYDQDGAFREEGGYQGMLRLLALPRPPTAVFVANNVMTIGALRAVKDIGADIPADVSLVGFDDLRLFELLAPAVNCRGTTRCRTGSNRDEAAPSSVARNDRAAGYDPTADCSRHAISCARIVRTSVDWRRGLSTVT